LIWNATSNTCEFNCFGVLHAVALENPTLSINNTCACEPNFYFNPYMPQCVINCSAFSGSMGINIDTETCQCKPRYTWIVSPPPFSCKLDCTAVPNSNGAVSTDNVNCVCNTGFKWYVNTTECRRDCTTDPLSTGVLATTTRCQCRPGTVWNIPQSKCVLSCATILNTNGAAAVAGACTCITTKYTWDPITLTCVYNC